MTETALIGSRSPLGEYWASRRNFDHIVDYNELHLLHGRSLGTLIIVDPALETGPLTARLQPEQATAATAAILRTLGDIKADRAILITTADLLPLDGDESSHLLDPKENAYLTARRNLHDMANLRFGRVLTVFIPELALPNSDFSLLGAWKNSPAAGELPAALELHQLYPVERIVDDVEKLLPLGVSRFVAAMPPLTASELVETFAPALIARHPDARPDPQGSCRQSLLSFHWHDPRDGYLATRETLLAELAHLIAP